MKLEYCDILSPQINLYYQKHSKHINVLSGVLSIISIICILSFIIFFSIDLFQHELQNFYVYNQCSSDTGIFPLNTTSMFHYVTIGERQINFQAVNLIGVKHLISNYMQDNDILNFDHWIYGPCLDEDIKGIEYLIINKTNLYEGACIKKMWNKEDMKYYTLSDANKFSYPQLEQVDSNSNKFNYGVIIEKCRNSTIKAINSYSNNTQEQKCLTNDEISQYIMESTFLSLNIIDHSIEVNNYSNPINTFLYKVTNKILGDTFTLNQLGFEPVIVNSNVGLIFNSNKKVNSYVYTQNTKSNLNSENSGILCSFYFWMQNRVKIFERKYLKIHTFLANIGGVTKIIITIAHAFNFFVNQYVIFNDSFKTYITISNKNKRFQKTTLLPVSNPGNTLKNRKSQLNVQHFDLKYMTTFKETSKENLKYPTFIHDNKGDVFLSTINNKTHKTKYVNVTEQLKSVNKQIFSIIFYNFCTESRKNKVNGQIIRNLLYFRKTALSEEFLFQIYAFYKMKEMMGGDDERTGVNNRNFTLKSSFISLNNQHKSELNYLQ